MLSHEPTPLYANMNLKVGSYNIQGQNRKNEIKLRKIKTLYNKGKFDILLLQETRSDGTDKELKKWQKVFNTKNVFLSDFGTNSVGAGIVIRQNDSFKVHQHFIDPGGRYVAIIGDHEESSFLILSLYSPSVSHKLSSSLRSLVSNYQNWGQNYQNLLLLEGILT